MIGTKAANIWAALWTRAAPRARAPLDGLVIPSSASAAPLRAMLAWQPDWKTAAIGDILRLRPGMLIDVGANVGQTLLDFLSAPVHSTYVGFEPNPVCHGHLSKFISTNRLDRCLVVPAALGERNGIAQLYSYGGDVDSGATTVSGLRPRLKSMGASIAMLRLDDIVQDLPDSDIALVKIDVEGGELAVLRGMEKTIRESKPWLLCEVLHRDVSAEPESFVQRCQDLTRFVADVDYRVLRMVHRGADGGIVRLDDVVAFPALEWDDETSPFACDYLFVPKGEVAAARETLGA